MQNLTPKAEPVAWGSIVGLIVAAAISYGLNITPELRDALIALVPLVIGLVWARQNVTPTSKEGTTSETA